jgi:glucose-1-phosphate thymidylyltransferase
MTQAVSKHLLPIYDKPMIYYPLTTLILAGVQTVWLVSDPSQEKLFRNLLGDGSEFGISISYVTQDKPRGIVDAFASVPSSNQEGPVWLALGDNLFFGSGLGPSLAEQNGKLGSSIFLKEVRNPQDFGVAEIQEGRITGLQEKPKDPRSSMCITGLYKFDETVWQKFKKVSPSPRGELEITDLLGAYLEDRTLNYNILGRGTYWLDTGTAVSMAKASAFVESVQSNSGDIVGSPHEAGLRMGNLESARFREIAKKLPESTYGDSLRILASNL